MQFDLEYHIMCIGPSEPSFLMALGLGVVLAVLVGRGLRRLDQAIRDRWRRLVYLPALLVASGLVLFAGTAVLTQMLFRVRHPSVELCTAFVWPGFIIPVVVMSIVSGRRPRRRAVQASQPGTAETEDGRNAK